MRRLSLPGTGAAAVQQPRAVAVFALLFGAYVGAAKLGIELPVARGVVTPVWAPSGIALAGLLLFGIRFWPAVALGAFVANATSDATLLVAAGIAVGNTLEAVLGAGLVQRLGFRPQLDRVRAVVVLAVAAVFSTAVAATNGITVLALADGIQDPYGTAWLLWWFGDLVGALMVAPVLLVLFSLRHERSSAARLAEAVAVLGAVAGVSAVVFFAGAWRYPQLILPLLVYATLRFRQVGAATTSFLVGALGTWGAVVGTIPIAADTATERVQIVQGLFVVVALSMLVVGATLAEREAGRAELAQAVASLREAQSVARVGSWRWDIAEDVVTWSEELYRIFGIPQETPVNYASYLERIHPDDRRFIDETVLRAYRDRKPFAFEHRIVRPDGIERVISSRGRVIVRDGDPVEMLGTAQDVTEHREAERVREDILSAVSHELRTPLTGVLGFAVTLEERRRDLDDESIGTIVAALGDAARRLDHLLRDLLDVERARRGIVAIEKRPTEIRDLLENVVASCPIDGRVVTITGDPVVADVDPPKLERIVENLVVNAAKHTPPESSIELSLRCDGPDLVLEVADDGPGVPDEYKDSIFEPFNRGPGPPSATPGTGIGLSLVARFAALHGGRSWVEDRSGGGASFLVSLPGCVRE
jgi:PAS domain S-box-containing protein